MCSYGLKRKHDLFIFSRKEKPIVDAESMELFDEDQETQNEEIYV